jgi:membrane protease YdiL (CAAX protease family)
VSSPENLLPQLQVEPPSEPMATPLAAAINPGAENPPWSGLDLLLIGMVLLAALFFFSATFFILALHGPPSLGISAAELTKNPGPLVIVPSMTFAYFAMLIAMYVLVTRRRRQPFWQAVGWRWPRNWWLGYMVAGGLLAVGLGELSRLLPIPKSLPMDRFFQNRSGAYLMMFFGVAVAPLAEEMLFRGFLYPVLDRWLETLFMTPRLIRRACVWILILAGWGYLEHRLPLLWSLLLAGSAFLATGALFVVRSLRLRERAHFVLLLGAVLVGWGLALRSIPDTALVSVTVVLLVAASLLGLLSMAAPVEVSAAGRWGRFLAVLLTSGSFAMVHSEQLGRAWGPLLVLFLVGLVLTGARVVTRSVTPGFLIHVGYNLSLFSLLYVGTDHFRHLERMTQ